MSLGLRKLFVSLVRIDKVALCAIACRWSDVISGGGPGVQDAASITNPTTQIVNDTTFVISRDQRLGTTLAVRLAYNAGASTLTPPIIKIFGRARDDDAWQPLYSLSGNLTATLTDAATDVTDGTFKYTTPHPTNHYFDTAGCDEFLVGVETAFAAGVGIVTDSKIQMKVI